MVNHVKEYIIYLNENHQFKIKKERNYLTMKKKILSIVLATLLLLVLASCKTSSAPQQPPTDTNNDAKEDTLPQISHMEYVCGSATGSFLAIGAAISDKVNEYYDGFPITAIPGPGSIGNIPIVASGDGDFSMSDTPFLLAAVKGETPYESSMPNLRAVARLQPEVVHFIGNVSGATSVDQMIEDKIKTKLGFYPPGNASTHVLSLLFKTKGYDDIEEISSYGATVYWGDANTLNDAWKDRQIDGYFTVQSVPGSSVTDALSARNGKLLGIEGDSAKIMVETMGFDYYTIKADTYPGQDEDVDTISMPVILFTRDDMDEDIVYNFCKAIYNNKEYFLNAHSSFAQFEPDKMHTGCGIELHPGAVKFYKEIGAM